MKKRITVAVLAFLIFFMGVRTEVHAVGTSEKGTKSTGRAYDEKFEALNDPLYSKYVLGTNLRATVSSFSEITHDSRFEKYDKIQGIDVSKYQGDINWTAVESDGIDFAIIRLGYRGMQEGTLQVDSYFEQNIKGAHKAGISVGVYFFTQAITVDEAEEEAKFVIEQLKKYKSYVTYPVIIDMESAAGSRLDNAGLSVTQKTEICSAFCEAIEKAGYTAGIYSNKNFFETQLNAGELDDYYIWMANYGDRTTYAGTYSMWQYSSTGSVKGIYGNVDLDVAYSLPQPGEPQELKISSLTTAGFKLSWKSVAKSDGYRVYRYDASGKLLDSKDTTSTMISYSKMESGSTYKFKVRAYKEVNGKKLWGKYSAAIVVTTKPDKVTNLKLSSVSANKLAVKWSKVAGAEGYRVYCYDASGKLLSSKNTTSNSMSYSGLESGVGYQFKVRPYIEADDAKIWGNYSAPITVTTKPGRVTNLKLSSIFTNKLVVKWSEVTGAEGYRVSLYDKRTKKYKTIGETRRTGFTIRGLEAGTLYQIRVAAYVKNDKKTYLGSYSADLMAATRPSK